MARRPDVFVVGPGGARASCLVGELTSTTVHFPRALGTPAASCQPPLFTFARSFHLHLLPHYLLLIVSGERLSFCLPVCLAFFFSFLFLFLFLLLFLLLFLFLFLLPLLLLSRYLSPRSSFLAYRHEYEKSPRFVSTETIH